MEYGRVEKEGGGENMKKLSGNFVGLITGSFLGLVHLLWAVLVALGYAQGLLDWILGLHFLDNPYTVGEFAVSRALTLVVVTFVVGYVAGYLFTIIWNMMGKKK